MNIGYDITSFVYNRGVSRYTYALLKGMSSFKDIDIYAYGYSTKTDFLKQKLSDIKIKKIVLRKIPVNIMDFLWQHSFNIDKSFFKKLDVFHAWDWIQPPISNDFKQILTVQDVSLFKFKSTAHKKTYKKHTQTIQKIKKFNLDIIVPTFHTKNDLVNLFNIKSSKIHVVYHGLADELKNKKKLITDKFLSSLKIKFNIKKPFILFVGSIEPRKNVFRLIQAWKYFSKQLDLVLIGNFEWGQKIPDIKGLKKLGFVSDLELLGFYKLSEFLAFPSIDEGFGFPILEAYLFEKNVLTSLNTACEEIALNGSILVDPLSVNSIKQGIEKILNLGQSEKKVLLQNQKKALEKFTIKNMVKNTKKVYEKIM